MYLKPFIMYKLHLDDIKKTDVQKLKLLFPHFERLYLYITLLKALGYNNKHHLFECYNTVKNQIISKKEDSKHSIPYDITRIGVIYNEHVFKNRLRITYGEALRTKRLLDRPNIYENWNSGNIRYADLSRVARGILETTKGNTSRIMADYPTSFYTRREKNYKFQYDGKLTEISGFVFDGMTISRKKYFLNKTFLHKYLDAFMEKLLKADNVIFNPLLMKQHEEFDFYAVAYISNKFKNVTVQIAEPLFPGWNGIRVFPKTNLEE